MRGAWIAGAVFAVIAVGGPAFAEEGTPAVAPASQPVAAGKLSYSHRMQGGVGLIFGSGYRGMVRYHNKPACEDVPSGGELKTFCHSRLPTFMDIQASFGVTRGLSVITDFRLGLEKDFTHSRPLALAPGIKYFIDADDRWKFFVTVQLAIDFSEQLPDVPRADVGLRNTVGFQCDVHRLFGVWVQLGDTLAFRRYFSFALDAAIGLEVRFPP